MLAIKRVLEEVTPRFKRGSTNSGVKELLTS
jgi:hypothetical protein